MNVINVAFFLERRHFMSYIVSMRLVLNKTKIREWTRSVGGSGNAVKMIVEKTACAAVTAERIALGRYPSEPSYLLRKALLELTGLTECELFVKEEQAS